MALLGKVFEGRWLCKERLEGTTYTMENIYNHNTINLSYQQLCDVMNGKNTIGHIMTCRFKNNPSSIGIFRYGNDTQKRRNKMMRKFARD